MSAKTRTLKRIRRLVRDMSGHPIMATYAVQELAPAEGYFFQRKKAARMIVLHPRSTRGLYKKLKRGILWGTG